MINWICPENKKVQEGWNITHEFEWKITCCVHSMTCCSPVRYIDSTKKGTRCYAHNWTLSNLIIQPSCQGICIILNYGCAIKSLHCKQLWENEVDVIIIVIMMQLRSIKVPWCYNCNRGYTPQFNIYHGYTHWKVEKNTHTALSFTYLRIYSLIENSQAKQMNNWCLVILNWYHDNT